MNNSPTSDAKEYFSDNNLLFEAIRTKVNSLVTPVANTYRRISVDIASQTAVTDANPDLSDFTSDDDLAVAEIWTRVNEEIALSGAQALVAEVKMIQVSNRVIELEEQGLAEQEVFDALNDFEPEMPSQANWEEARYEDAEGLQTSIKVTTLFDPENPEYATSIQIYMRDELIERRIKFTWLGDQPSFVTNRVEPIKDALAERVQVTLSAEDVFTARLMMMGSDIGHRDEDIDMRLSDLWLKYQGTSKEQEVGPLLDEVRDRYTAAQDSLVLARQFGETNIPNFQQLTEIKDYLDALSQ